MEKNYTDSAGKQWTVWMQDDVSSCAAAALYMTVSLYEQRPLKGGETRFLREMEAKGSKPIDFTAFGVGNKSMNQIGEVLSGLSVKNSTNYVVAKAIGGILA